jgi:hypothetical protein
LRSILFGGNLLLTGIDGAFVVVVLPSSSAAVTVSSAKETVNGGSRGPRPESRILIKQVIGLRIVFPKIVEQVIAVKFIF